MATQVSQKWAYAQRVAKQLASLMKENAPTFEEIDHLINQLRIACEVTIFTDFEYATKEEVEAKLWEAHISINTRYRKLVEAYRKGDQKKHVVERRKLEKRYADFIKTSQFFYKGYIQRLASHFTGMDGLRRIAHRLSLEVLSVDERVKVTPEVEHMIEMSCHATLLRLGDLSRYRNNLRTKDRSWEPAMGYYALANDLYPDSGSAHNQMAVIALAEVNHLHAVYHIYRALAVKEPHPLAKSNLELEFKKILSAWKKNHAQPKTDSLGTLTSWFCRLHAKFYEGVEFSTRDELENEVLSRMALLLKEQTFGATLEKFVLINVAAEAYAAERITEEGDSQNPELVQSFFFLLNFNVRMFFVLLQVLQPELEDTSSGEDLPNGTDGSASTMSREKITAISRRILPALRQYSIWLAAQAKILVAGVTAGPTTVHIKEMWKMYADVLTRIANIFPASELQRSTYLLEEDESTVGFKPFRDHDIPRECDLYTDSDGNLKPRLTDPGVERNHPNIEMQARVLDILLVGLSLQLNDTYPITLNGDTGTPVFMFVEEGLPLANPTHPQAFEYPFASPPQTNNDNFAVPEPVNRIRVASDESVAASDSHNSMDTDMHRMVDNLLETSRSSISNEPSYGMHSRTANELYAALGSNGVHSHQQSTPKMLPSLPGLWSSPFTPQPNELQPISPDRPTTARQLSPLPLATSQQRMAAVEALDQMTGYDSTRSGSWGRRSARPTSNPTAQPINQLLQDSLSQQYGPTMSMSSSAFSEASSLYANTTLSQYRPIGGELRRGHLATMNGNNSTFYDGASDFEKNEMLQSSLWYNSQPVRGGHVQTPPSGQGG